MSMYLTVWVNVHWFQNYLVSDNCLLETSTPTTTNINNTIDSYNEKYYETLKK